LKWQEDVREHIDRCVGCLACEIACPSGVQYGEILEQARDRLEKERPSAARSVLLDSTTRPTILKAQLLAGRLLPGGRVPGLVSRLLSGQPAEADMPSPQASVPLPGLDPKGLSPVRGEVYFLEGCAMKLLYPRVHEASRRLLRRVGFSIREVRQGCCGALHAHYGHLKDAASMARELLDSMPGDLPVVVNSAGCGSTMKQYGSILGGEAASRFSSRVRDISEFLLENGLLDALGSSAGIKARVTYHDACHLGHGQRITRQPRELLAAVPDLQYVELQEADTCCGSAGIYNVTQPKLARALLERKWRNIAQSGASLVATGNPGCHAWIAQAAREHGRSVQVLHTAELLEASFIGVERFA
jgi:glycolate oxidase iron-sulfur subunit